MTCVWRRTGQHADCTEYRLGMPPVGAAAHSTPWPAARPSAAIYSAPFDLTLLVAPALAGLLAGAVAVADPRLYAPLLLADMWLLGYHHVVATYTRMTFDARSLRRHRFLAVDLLVLMTALTLFGGVYHGRLGDRLGLPVSAVVPLHASGLRHLADVLPRDPGRTGRRLARHAHRGRHLPGADLRDCGAIRHARRHVPEPSRQGDRPAARGRVGARRPGGDGRWRVGAADGARRSRAARSRPPTPGSCCRTSPSSWPRTS